MKVNEFIQGRYIQAQVVYKYMQRHRHLFKGHTHKAGREIILDDMHIDDITDMCKDAGIKHIDYADADDTYAYLFEQLTDAYYTKGKQSEKRFKDIQRLETGINDTHKDMPYTKSPF